MLTLQRGFEFAPGFRLQEYLGRGQFGQVWRASAPGGTPMAVKFINNSEGKAHKEFLAIERIKQIQHANLMTITASWLLDDQGRVIDEVPNDATATFDSSELSPSGQSGMVVMPQQEPAMLVVAMLLGGQSLLARLKDCVRKDGKGIPPRELLSYMEDSAKGLDFLNEPRHDLGNGPVAIQHCDIKPANIVLYGNAAMLCDFGLVRILTRNQATADNPSGTPAYMAPEAIEGKPSQASDQYSLAITYYHLRTGLLPIADGSIFEVLDAHRRGALEFGKVPQVEQDVLRRATHLDWSKRFATNAEFVDHLRESLRGVLRQGVDVPAPALESTQDVGRSGHSEASETRGDIVHSEATQVGLAGEPASEHKLPLLETSAIPTSLRETIRRVPRSVFAIVGSGALGLFLFSLLGRFPDKDTDPVTVVSLAELSLEELFVEAHRSFSVDAKRSSEVFGEALRRQPRLASPPPIQTAKLHRDAVETLVLNQSGDKLVSTGYDNEPFVWPVNDSATAPLGTPLRLTSLDRSVNREAIAIVKDGGLLAAGAGKQVGLWDLGASVRSGQDSLSAKVIINSFNDSVLSLTHHTTSPEHLIIGVADQSVQVFESANLASSSEPIARFDVVDAAATIKIDPSGKWLFIRGQDDGKLVAYSWPEIMTSQTEKRSPTIHSITADGDRARQFAFPGVTGTSNTMVIVGSENGSLTLSELDDGGGKVLSRVQPHASSIEAMCAATLSTDNSEVIVTSASDGSLCECAMSGQLSIQRTWQLSTEPVSCVDISGDGRWIAAGTWDGHWWLIDRTVSENRGAKIPVDGDSSVTVESIKIHESGKIVLVGCSDGAIRVWDLANAQLIAISQLLPERELRF